MKEKNKVVIIGEDHTNTLGAIRQFGENGIKPYVIIIKQSKYVSVIKSKYINQYWICNNEEVALLTLLSSFQNENIKPVVIPTCDKTALLIDKNYDRLSEYFILPNIKNQANQILYYMNKYNQYELFKTNHIQTANSYTYDKKEGIEFVNHIKYPCIIKPIVSAGGKKDDITICHDRDSLIQKLNSPTLNSYSSLLIQDFINYDTEYDIVGYAYHGDACIPGIIKKVRIWPEKRGSTTKGIVMPSKELNDLINHVKQLMIQIGYCGLFDVDIFMKDNEIYLNEINFRNSGNSYAYGDSYVCYYWYLSCIEDKFILAPMIESNYYFLDDQADIHNVLERKIKLKEYLNDKKNCKVKLVYHKNDKKPSRSMFFYKIMSKIKFNRIIDLAKMCVHKTDEFYVFGLDDTLLQKEYINKEYKIIKFNKDTIAKFYQDQNQVNEIKKEHKNKDILGIALMHTDQVVARGILKYKGINDRFVKIKNNNSYVICHIYVCPEYRGNNIQCDVIRALINNYVTNNDSKIYAVVYSYNIPSYKNFKKLGFEIKYKKVCIRFLKQTIGKINL